MSATPWLAVLALAVIILVATRINRRHVPLALIGLALLAPLPVLADTGGSTIVNLSEIAATVAALVLAGLAALLRGLTAATITYFETKTQVTLDQATRRYLEDALYNGISWARAEVGQRLGTVPLGVDVKSETAAEAVRYVQKHVPDALAHFGLTPEAVERMVVSRMQQTGNGQLAIVGPELD